MSCHFQPPGGARESGAVVPGPESGAFSFLIIKKYIFYETVKITLALRNLKDTNIWIKIIQ